MHKLTVGVLRGGPSNWYDQSLKTGGAVLSALPQTYKSKDILITKDGRWNIDGFERNPEQIVRHVDVIINALHGDFGGDGTVQKLLEHFSVPYTGSKPLAASLCANLHLSKKAFEHHGIRSAPYVVVGRDDTIEDVLAYLRESFFMPAVVRPTNVPLFGGVFVNTYAEIPVALTEMFKYSPIVIVEEHAGDRRASCAAVEHFRGQDVYVAMPAETIMHESGSAIHHVPGHFSDEEKELLQQLARKTHKDMGLRHYSTIHFALHPKKGVSVTGVDVMPELSKDSHFSHSIDAVGLTFPDFLDHTITLALQGK